MPTLRNAVYLLIVLTAVSAAYAAPWTVTDDGKRWEGSTRYVVDKTATGGGLEARPGHVLVPAGLRKTAPSLLKVDAGTVRLKTQPELDAEAATAASDAQTAQRVSRLDEFVSARDALESLQAARAEMLGVKILTRIDARIATATTRRNAAFAALRDL